MNSVKSLVQGIRPKINGICKEHKKSSYRGRKVTQRSKKGPLQTGPWTLCVDCNKDVTKKESINQGYGQVKSTDEEGKGS